MHKNRNRLEFQEFPRVWGIINIPENMTIYRSGTRQPVLSRDPRFFSNLYTARLYEEEMRNRGKVYNTYGCVMKDIKLMDLRTLRYLFLEYVAYNRLYFAQDELNLINKAMFALGLMSLEQQFEYMQKNPEQYQKWIGNYADITDVHYNIECHLENSLPDEITAVDDDPSVKHYQHFGNRISDSETDDEVVALLRSIFGYTIDGYIAPIIDTVWHDFQFNSEVCLFNPSESLKYCFVIKPEDPDPDALTPPVHITKIISGVTTEIMQDLVKGGSSERTTCSLPKRAPFIDNPNFANERDTSDITANLEKVWKTHDHDRKEETKTVQVPMKNIYNYQNTNRRSRNAANNSI